MIPRTMDVMTEDTLFRELARRLALFDEHLDSRPALSPLNHLPYPRRSQQRLHSSSIDPISTRKATPLPHVVNSHTPYHPPSGAKENSSQALLDTKPIPEQITQKVVSTGIAKSNPESVTITSAKIYGSSPITSASLLAIGPLEPPPVTPNYDFSKVKGWYDELKKPSQTPDKSSLLSKLNRLPELDSAHVVVVYHPSGPLQVHGAALQRLTQAIGRSNHKALLLVYHKEQEAELLLKQQQSLYLLLVDKTLSSLLDKADPARTFALSPEQLADNTAKLLLWQQITRYVLR